MKPLRRMLLLALVAGSLGGCASLNQLRSDVVSFGEWPAGRAPGSYAFERLPSQQAPSAQSSAQDSLEAAARPALAAAGFAPVAAGAQADVLVALAARETRSVSPFSGFAGYQGLWLHGGVGRRGAWGHPGLSAFMYSDLPRQDVDVVLIVRERSTAKPLYEARASGVGSAAASSEGLRALFTAALSGFPKTNAEPRVVAVPLSPVAP